MFTDRRAAGRALAQHLKNYADRADVIVLGLPRGGVVVAYEVASALHAPLDVFVVRKLGAPGYEELAMGAVAGGGLVVLNDEVVTELEVDAHTIRETVAREAAEVARREEAYRRGRPAPEVSGRIVILVDDGLATGATMKAAAAAIRQRGPSKLIVAAPVGSSRACAELRREADEVICAETPEPFLGVGRWYEHFEQTQDAEVSELLNAAPGAAAPGAPQGGTYAHHDGRTHA